MVLMVELLDLMEPRSGVGDVLGRELLYLRAMRDWDHLSGNRDNTLILNWAIQFGSSRYFSSGT